MKAPHPSLLRFSVQFGTLFHHGFFPHHSKKDSESVGMATHIAHWRMILDQGYCTSPVKSHSYSGQGTEDDPFVVGWLEDDNRNPYNWPLRRRAFITCCISGSSLAAALSSSAYTGSNIQIMQEFSVSTEVLDRPT